MNIPVSTSSGGQDFSEGCLPLKATHHVDYGRFFLFSYLKFSLNEIPLQGLIGSQAFPLKSGHVVSDGKLYPSNWFPTSRPSHSPHVHEGLVHPEGYFPVSSFPKLTALISTLSYKFFMHSNYFNHSTYR